MLGWQSLRNRSAARLPRFRLFGDTMNTAARMMQKGLPGEVGEINIPRFFWQKRARKPIKFKKKGGKQKKNRKMRMNTSWVRVKDILSGEHTSMNGSNTFIFNDHIIL